MEQKVIDKMITENFIPPIYKDVRAWEKTIMPFALKLTQYANEMMGNHCILLYDDVDVRDNCLIYLLYRYVKDRKRTVQYYSSPYHFVNKFIPRAVHAVARMELLQDKKGLRDEFIWKAIDVVLAGDIFLFTATSDADVFANLGTFANRIMPRTVVINLYEI